MSDRVLIFIVAYNAGNHIRSVLDRLPKEVFNNSSFHVLIIDDCSKDQTAQTASTHVSHYKYDNVTVLRNTINMGYGGNQKVGYRYAVENGFGLVILLHGDGQYAPELVLEFVKRWEEEKADVVLGSRMIEKSRARAGGMPFYKWIGNQVLTTFQNYTVGSALSEFHTGYRAYDTGFLKKIPFELNTNDFHFDTEILLQAFALEAKVAEFSIPTHYGDEICHVNGMQYAWDVVKACLEYKFQKIGFFCSMQYRGLLKHQESQSGSAQYHVIERIRPGSKVLNLGRNSEFLNQQLSALSCKVTTRTVDLEAGKPEEDVSAYDYVLSLDRIERYSDTENFLVNCRYSMGSLHQPTFVLSAGNVAFLGLRILLAFGTFNYGERGILKVNHNRLFTLSSVRRMLHETGYESGEVRGIGVPFNLVFPGKLGRLLARISDGLARFYPSMFAYQFLIECKPKPHSFMLISNAQKFYDSKPAISSIQPQI
ncbi:MAG: glycosyltransferase family 2 protein [Bdellovibrionota bacterium]